MYCLTSCWWNAVRFELSLVGKVFALILRLGYLEASAIDFFCYPTPLHGLRCEVVVNGLGSCSNVAVSRPLCRRVNYDNPYQSSSLVSVSYYDQRN